MQVTRREMLVRSGEALAALALGPLAQGARAISNESIKIKTEYGQKALHFECQHNRLPKDYELAKWWDIKKLYPKAFVADDDGLDYTEECAKNVLANELTERASSHFLHQLEIDHKDFNEDVVKRRLPYYVFIYLYWQANKLLDEIKEVPYPGIKIPDEGLKVGRTELNSYENHFNANRNFIRNHQGIFTNFTEEEADEIVHKLTQVSYDKVYEYVRGKLEEYYSYAKVTQQY